MTSPLDPSARVPRAASLSCASCGAAIAPRANGWAVTIVCGTCGAVLDATDPNLQVLQRQQAAITVTPTLALGTRGTWHSTLWELIGFQVVTIEVDGTEYSWSEYVGFNPYRGFLYLSEYQGHWNVIDKLHRRPAESTERDRPVATLDGRVFKHFQTATARTTLALGEFPWALRVGDAVQARDFIAPPFILSAEAADGEITWSLGTYTSPELIAKAFAPSTKLQSPVGVFANQPNPHDGVATRVGKRMLAFVAMLIVMLLANMAMSRGESAYARAYSFAPGTDDSAAFVTPAFVLEGRPSSVTINIDSDLENNWTFFTFTLINETTGDTRDVSQQVSYYSGRDSDGNWTEGSKRESVRVAAVPAGRYFLRVAPEGGESGSPPVHYSLSVKHDTPSFGFYLIALIALIVPVVLSWLPKRAFETRRWQESDYGAETTSSASDSGDDE